jgi:hypothetical protein
MEKAFPMFAYGWMRGRNGSHSGLMRIIGVLGIVYLSMVGTSHGANERKPCGLVLDSYKELARVAEFRVVLRCDGGQKEGFPLNEPLLIGLSATTSDTRENDRVEIEYDFPLQNLVVSSDTTAVALTFHAQVVDISGKTHVYAIAWPRSFLQDCPAGRSGCAKFGYALAMPVSLSKFCLQKDEGGEIVVKDDFMCTGSTDYRFKFR